MKILALALVFISLQFMSVSHAQTVPVADSLDSFMSEVLGIINSGLSGQEKVQFQALGSNGFRISYIGEDGKQLVSQRIENGLVKGINLPTAMISENSSRQLDLRPFLIQIAAAKTDGLDTAELNKLRPIVQQMGLAIQQFLITDVNLQTRNWEKQKGRLPARISPVSVIRWSIYAVSLSAMTYGAYVLMRTPNYQAGLGIMYSGFLGSVFLLFDFYWSEVEDWTNRGIIDIVYEKIQKLIDKKIVQPLRARRERLKREAHERKVQEIRNKNVSVKFGGTHLELKFANFLDVQADGYVITQYGRRINEFGAAADLMQRSRKAFADYYNFAQRFGLEPGSVMVTKTDSGTSNEIYVIHLPIEGLGRSVVTVRNSPVDLDANAKREIKTKMQWGITESLYKGLLQARSDGLQHVSIPPMLTQSRDNNLSLAEFTEAVLAAISKFNLTQNPFAKITIGIDPKDKSLDPIESFNAVEAHLAKHGGISVGRCIELFE